MATIKSFTDLEQSKKLAEILPIESADMCYINGDTDKIIIRDWQDEIHDEDDVPCWSLASLLNVLGEGYSLGNRKGKYYVCMSHIHHEISLFDNPVDACVDIIIKLKEADLL